MEKSDPQQQLTNLQINPDNNDFQMLEANNQNISTEDTKNYFIQKRNRMNSTEIENINRLEIDEEDTVKIDNLYDSVSDIGPKPSPLKKNQPQTHHEQFMCKKMSIDLDDDQTMKKGMICNCKNSGCLKRYCECFSRMKYCDSNCQCKNCFNNINYEKERNEAIRNYLIKSPVSFKKINLDLNNITCNCKKSNCLKNYCECFQLGMKCTFNCRCVECKNKNLFDKKLFYVENKTSNKENDKNNTIKTQTNQNENNNINIEIDKNLNITNEKKGNDTKITNQNKQNSSISFVVDKINNTQTQFINNKYKNRKRFFSFDEGMYQWNNLNLKKIEISNNKLIIDNYNINNINNNKKELVNDNFEYQKSHQNTQPNFLFFPNLNNNHIIRKNSAFSAINN